MEKLGQLFEQLQQKAAAHRRLPGPFHEITPKRLPDRHPTRDFFVADILDCTLKDDHHSMEHPFFSLAKKPDRKARRYEHQGTIVTITPSILGLATIWDKDILIYAVSQLIDAMNRNQPTSRKVRLKAYDLLIVTNRHAGGRSYNRLKEAFRRLRGTTIETNIVTNGTSINHGFGLIDEWKIVERTLSGGRMVAVDIVLSEWLYNGIMAREVLTLNRDYFRLDGGLERRLYELGRKHCGHQARWAVSVELLHKKSGSTDILKRFRAALKRLVLMNPLPDYRLQYESESDKVVFSPRDLKNAPANKPA